MAIKSSRYVAIISKEQEEKSLAELYQRLAELQQQVDDLESQIDGIGNDISGINEQIAALQNEIAEIEMAISNKADADNVVNSVNGKKGVVALSAADVGATPAMQLVSADSTITALSANRYYVFSAPVVSLNIATVETSLDEIVLRFTAGDGASISFPASLAWINEPSFEVGKTYLISIVNNIAVAAEVTV